MTEWLQGLVLWTLNIGMTQWVRLAIKMGSIDENPSEKLKAEVIDNYWSFMANVILWFEPKRKETMSRYFAEFETETKVINVKRLKNSLSGNPKKYEF